MTTIKHRGKNYHVLQPGERLLRDGSWVTKKGKKGKGRCIDPEKAASLAVKGQRRGKPKRRSAGKSGAKKGKSAR